MGKHLGTRPPIPLSLRLWGWRTLLRASFASSAERCTHLGTAPMCFGCAMASTAWSIGGQPPGPMGY